MYSLLQRFFQNIFHSGQPALNGAADAALANALGCRDLDLAHAEKCWYTRRACVSGSWVSAS